MPLLGLNTPRFFILFLLVTAYAQLASSSKSSAAPLHPRYFLTSARVEEIKRLAPKDKTLRSLIERNTVKALWLLDNSNYSIDSSDTPRFNGRRCMRVMTETIIAAELGNASGPILPETTVKLLRDRALNEYIKAASRKPFDWYVPYSPQDPLDSALEVSEALSCLAIGYDWLYPRLNEEQRRLGRASIGLGLKRYLEEYATLFTTPDCWAHCESNWNSVINNSAVFAALVVKGEDLPGVNLGNQVSQTIVAKAKAVLPKYYRLFSANGAFPEGSTYLNYSTEFLALANEALLSTGASDLGISKFPGIKVAGTYMTDLMSPISPLVQPGSKDDRVITTNYSDAAATISPSLAALSWFGYRLNQSTPTATAHLIGTVDIGKTSLNSHQDGTMDALSILWYKSTSVTYDFRKASRLYGDSNGSNNIAFIWKKSDAKVDLYATLKGGRPQHTSHGHMDAGSFILEALGRRWSADLGPERYTSPGYFSTNPPSGMLSRWDYLRANAFGHNVFVVGDQLPVPTANSALKISGDTKVRAAVANLKFSYGNLVKDARRVVSITPAGQFIVRDVLFGVKDGMPVEWRMIYCSQSRYGVPVVQSTTPRCMRPVADSFIDVTSNTEAVIAEERIEEASCKAKFLAINVRQPAGGILKSFPLDATLPENSPAMPPPVAIDQVENRGCYVLSLTAPPIPNTPASEPSSNHLEFELEMTPKIAN